MDTNNPTGDAAQLREQMRQLRSHMDADVESFVENTRVLLDWHSYFESAPWLFLGAAALTGYLLIPSKARWVTVDLDQLAELAKHRQVVVQDQTAPAQGSVGPSLGKMVMGLLWRGAVAVASQQLKQFLSPRPPSSGQSPETTRPSSGR